MSNDNVPLTVERLKELLSYDPLTGSFRWLVNRQGPAKAGDAAGSVTGKGYIQIGIDGRLYLAHRLAFLYMTGEFPKNEGDHHDLCKSNNVWSNLRDATSRQNKGNQTVRVTNLLGVKGVSIEGKKFVAKIRVNGKKKHLGTFTTVETASAAYAKAANDNFKEFARVA
jgi:HNH endonuclease